MTFQPRIWNFKLEEGEVICECKRDIRGVNNKPSVTLTTANSVKGSFLWYWQHRRENVNKHCALIGTLTFLLWGLPFLIVTYMGFLTDLGFFCTISPVLLSKTLQSLWMVAGSYNVLRWNNTWGQTIKLEQLTFLIKQKKSSNIGFFLLFSQRHCIGAVQFF